MEIRCVSRMLTKIDDLLVFFGQFMYKFTYVVTIPSNICFSKRKVDDMDEGQEATPRIRLWCTLDFLATMYA